jgi:hypothetical protein
MAQHKAMLPPISAHLRQLRILQHALHAGHVVLHLGGLAHKPLHEANQLQGARGGAGGVSSASSSVHDARSISAWLCQNKQTGSARHRGDMVP